MPLWSASMKLSTLAPTSEAFGSAPAALHKMAATAAANPTAPQPRCDRFIDFPFRPMGPICARIYHRPRPGVLSDTGAASCSGVGESLVLSDLSKRVSG